MSRAPFMDHWSRHLRDRAIAAGVGVAVWRGRCGSTRWRINGGRPLTTFEANRRLEVMIYGKAYP